MELLNSEYLWLYAVLAIWLAIALFLAYKETIKNHNQFLLGSFLNLTFEYTVMLAIKIISAFDNSKNRNSSNSSSNKEKTITNVRFSNGHITVFYKYGDRIGNYSAACTELVNWTEHSVTVKIRTGSHYFVQTMNAAGSVIDSYYEKNY
ncbi:MAG: hypothetical protein PHO62_01960 [Sulfurimonas sp.]|uniref:hypothetical protein n=1 Tax=Sulfurimonas sp. TaxID=2022749 RepID=UPI002601C075|nr:hypothetical protein [Sulfurimonas sp.]MDD5372172.1 hypothetical protein [Sulfurimonas sp.]